MNFKLKVKTIEGGKVHIEATRAGEFLAALTADQGDLLDGHFEFEAATMLMNDSDFLAEQGVVELVVKLHKALAPQNAPQTARKASGKYAKGTAARRALDKQVLGNRTGPVQEVRRNRMGVK